jgi:hypothetical protein
LQYLFPSKLHHAAILTSTQNELLPSLHILKTVAAISTSTQSGCRHLYIYSKQLPLSLHLLKMVAAISTFTQNGCHHLHIYSKWLPQSLHILKMSRCDNEWPKKGGEHFPTHEIGRIYGGRGFRTSGNVLQIGGNTFYDWKYKILMKILEFKRSRIGVIAEFRGIPSGFPNQD